MRLFSGSSKKIPIFSLVIYVFSISTAAALDRVEFSQFPIMTIKDEKHDISPPQADHSSIISTAESSNQLKKNKHHQFRPLSSQVNLDEMIQAKSDQPNPAITLLKFKGAGAEFHNSGDATPNGAVGKYQYVQWMSDLFAVYDKKTGQRLYGPVSPKSLWKGFGGVCESAYLRESFIDPMVSYDKMANRWVLSSIDENEHHDMYHCIAVSVSDDALGSYYRYSFYTNNQDFTKTGIWPDAYYFGHIDGPNLFGLPDTPGGARNICAVDRAKMLKGQSATMQCANIQTTGDFLSNPLPSDFDGKAPPDGTPNYFAVMNFDKQALQFYSFHVDWIDPKKSTVSGPISVPVASFNRMTCPESEDDAFDDVCIHQPGTSQRLESLSRYLMQRLAYRYASDGTAQWVVNHTVRSNDNVASIRWYQLKLDTNNKISILQQGTFRPDSTSRMNGSMAMDKVGNIALGYSASSDTIYPSGRITGRLNNDPHNELRNEIEIATGDTNLPNIGRFGDFSSMVLDPLDDCTFWYTGEYFTKEGKRNLNDIWSTFIVAFQFPNCAKSE